MHIGNREEAKMKLALSLSEILTNSTVRKKKTQKHNKRKIPNISGFASVPTSASSVFL